MAAGDSSEMTIVVRARDEATRVMRSIGGTISGIGRGIGRLLLAPVLLLGRQMGGVLKSFFSLRSLLLGGGIFAVFGALMSNLAKNATTFQAVFGAGTQQKINAVAEAMSRLKASVISVFGSVVGEFSGGMVETLDAIARWLRQNKEAIVRFLREVVEAIKQMIVFIRALASGAVKLGDIWKGFLSPGDTFDLTGEKGQARARVREGLEIQQLADAYNALAEASTRAIGRFDPQFVAPPLSDTANAVEQMSDLLRTVRSLGGEYTKAGEAAVKAANDALKLADATGRDSGGLAAAMDAATQALDQALDRLFRWDNAITETKADVNDVADALRGLRDVWRDSFRFDREQFEEGVAQLREFREELARLRAEDLAAFRADLTAIADLLSNHITDGLMGIIDGTKSLGAAFKEMALNILRDIGRMLIQLALFRIIASALGLPVQPQGLGGLNLSGGGRASGGPVSAGRGYVVGENGPEYFQPGTSGYVHPNGSGGGVQLVQNFYGNANPREVERAARRGVMSGLESSNAFRRKLRSA